MSVQALTWVFERSQSSHADRLVLLSIANQCGGDDPGVARDISGDLRTRVAYEAALTETGVDGAIESLRVLGELAVFSRSDADYYVLTKFPRQHCWYCGMQLWERKTIDHRIPVSRGGTDGRENRCYACQSCNSRKASRTVDEFREFLGVTHFFAETPDGALAITREKT